MKIICFGDSLTFGHGLPLKEKWHVIVEEKTGIKMINRGVSGNTTSDMLGRFNRQALLQKPDALILMGGYNDIFFEASWETAKDNLLKMMKEALEKGIEVFMAVPPPISCPKKFFSNEALIDFEKIIIMSEEFCQWLRNFLIMNNCLYIDFGEGIDWLKDDLYLDGIHPNSKGSLLMATKVSDFLHTNKFF